MILLILLIIVAFVGYRYMFKKDNSSNSDVAAESGGSIGGEPPIGADLLQKLATLKSLNIDETFFKDKTFISLIDFSVPIDSSLKIGRDNPFSPIERLAGSVSSSSSSLKQR